MRSPSAGSTRGAGRWLAAIALAICAGCGDGAEADRDARAAPGEREPPPSIDELEAWSLPIEEVERAAERLAGEAAEHEASPEGVRRAREAARLRRAIAKRRGDDGALAEARRLLTAASRRKSLEGACEAALELAALEARDAVDLGRAYAIAYRTARRFAGMEGREACVAEARRMTSVLDGYRPAPDVLAAIDADPDADDPSAATARANGRSDVARWAAGRGDVGGARLGQIAVYGAVAPGGERVDRDAVVRIVLAFDRVALFEHGELPADGALPKRAYVDFQGIRVAPDLPRTVPVDAGGVARVRIGTPGPGKTRVVFDLERGVESHLFFLTDPFRVVIDFQRSEAVPASENGLSVVVLDPGHGGNDFGARNGELREARLVMDISRRVADVLRRRLPSTRVLLTRTTDDPISLEQRVAFANAVSADAFVSIHLNADDEPVEHGGVATFVLDTTNDRQAMRLAARENGTTTAEVSGIQTILAHLHRSGQVGEARRLAESIQRATVTSARTMLPSVPDRGVKSAMFYVLVGARMPAVLVEASFITQPDEAAMLRTERYRQKLAEGIAEGIVEYARRQR